MSIGKVYRNDLSRLILKSIEDKDIAITTFVDIEGGLEENRRYIEAFAVEPASKNGYLHPR